MFILLVQTPIECSHNFHKYLVFLMERRNLETPYEDDILNLVSSIVLMKVGMASLNNEAMLYVLVIGDGLKP